MKFVKSWKEHRERHAGGACRGLQGLAGACRGLQGLAGACRGLQGLAGACWVLELGGLGLCAALVLIKSQKTVEHTSQTIA